MGYTFRDIKVWQKAHELVSEIYKITAGFPVSEKYGLVSQIRRSAASVPTNIVEGYKKGSDKDFTRYLCIADGSLEETKYHLLLARDLKYLDCKKYDHLTELADEVGKMLFGFKKTLRA